MRLDFVMIAPLLQLILASSLSLDVGYFFVGSIVFFINGYSAVSCDSGAFVRKR